MKKTTLIAIAALLLYPCFSYATPNGGILTQVNEAKSVSEKELASLKKATGSTTSVLGLVAFGDASIETLCKSAGIKEVRYIDKKTFNLLNAYALFNQETFTIYGN